MQLTVTTDDEKVVCVEIDADEVVDNLKAILTVETGVPMTEQVVMFQGNPLADQDKLSAKGVSDGDLLVMSRTPSQAQSQVTTGQANIQEIIRKIQEDPNSMSALEANNPRLAAAVRSGDVATFAAALQQDRERQRQIAEEEKKLQADPFNAEAQKKIEELIREKNVEENFLQAMEHTPEVFGSVTMLYVNMEVNNVPVQAFVDSGAQVTIMTASFAEKCGLMRLVDKRYAGVAVGVGQSKIIGRVHQCPLKVRGSYVTSSITILEQDSGPQYIFGLDNLSRHQCCIDLKNKVLKFGTCNEELPFLPEHEILERQQFAHKEGDPNQPGSSTAAGTPVSPQPQPPPPAADAPVSPELEAKVVKLMDLGFDREKCLAALEAAQGNEDAAASILFGGLF